MYIYVKKGTNVQSQVLDTELTYDADLRKYVLPHNLNINGSIILLAKQNPDEFTLTVYAGGVSYNATTKSFELPTVMHEVSLSSSSRLPLSWSSSISLLPLPSRSRDLGLHCTSSLLARRLLSSSPSAHSSW